MPESPPDERDDAVPARVFRLPPLTYLVVLFLIFCVLPLAFTDDGRKSSAAVFGPRALLLLIPVLAVVFIARTATIVSARGITVRALFGSRTLTWDEVRGLSVDRRAVYAVGKDGALRLPCIRVANLAAVAGASGGRLPEVAEPTPKYAPRRRR